MHKKILYVKNGYYEIIDVKKAIIWLIIINIKMIAKKWQSNDDDN